MNSDKDEQIEPVCRFGPGGDFVYVWPSESSKSLQPSANRLTALLASLSEMLSALLGPEFKDALTADRLSADKEKLEYALRSAKADRPAYPTAAAIIKNNSLFPGEPMLFVGNRPTGRKSRHRIRAYRRTAKKRPALSFPGQASLFETKFKNAKTA